MAAGWVDSARLRIRPNASPILSAVASAATTRKPDRDIWMVKSDYAEDGSNSSFWVEDTKQQRSHRCNSSRHGEDCRQLLCPAIFCRLSRLAFGDRSTHRQRRSLSRTEELGVAGNCPTTPISLGSFWGSGFGQIVFGSLFSATVDSPPVLRT